MPRQVGLVHLRYERTARRQLARPPHVRLPAQLRIGLGIDATLEPAETAGEGDELGVGEELAGEDEDRVLVAGRPDRGEPAPVEFREANAFHNREIGAGIIM